VNEDKATRYQRLRRRAELLALLVLAVLLVVALTSGLSFKLRELGSAIAIWTFAGWEEPITVIGYTIALLVLVQFVEFPFAFYQGYRLEHRYGVSNERFVQWLRNHVKGVWVGGVLAVLGASVVYAALRWNPAWWWVLAAALFTMAAVVLAQLAPVLLLPLFYAFKPLDRPTLVARLMALASRAGARVLGVHEWALSAHTKKANAALTGIGRTRRILLSDTLLAAYSDEEIEVVLAHELSHHVHHDLWRSLALQAALLFGGFFLAHLTLMSLASPLGLRGVDDPAGLPLLLLTGGLWGLVTMPIANAMSRRHERRADRDALDLTGRPEAFITAMKRLGQQNLAEERPSAFVRWFFHSHPPLLERIEAARLWRAPGDAASSAPADVARASHA
jgi:STE24 endopeptidase